MRSGCKIIGVKRRAVIKVKPLPWRSSHIGRIFKLLDSLSLSLVRSLPPSHIVWTVHNNLSFESSLNWNKSKQCKCIINDLIITC